MEVELVELSGADKTGGALVTGGMAGEASDERTELETALEAAGAEAARGDSVDTPEDKSRGLSFSVVVGNLSFLTLHELEESWYWKDRILFSRAVAS